MSSPTRPAHLDAVLKQNAVVAHDCDLALLRQGAVLESARRRGPVGKDRGRGGICPHRGVVPTCGDAHESVASPCLRNPRRVHLSDHVRVTLLLGDPVYQVLALGAGAKLTGVIVAPCVQQRARGQGGRKAAARPPRRTGVDVSSERDIRSSGTARYLHSGQVASTDLIHCGDTVRNRHGAAAFRRCYSRVGGESELAFAVLTPSPHGELSPPAPGALHNR